MSKEELYVGREQTLVKHFILQKYLERFAHIVGTHQNSLTYVDCFSGPWNVRSDNFEDSSFGIALQELRKARDTHAKHGRKLKLRCFFLEKDPAAYGLLESFAKSISDVEMKTRHATLEESVKEIVGFVRAGGQKSFPFIFIDPTGWSGFGMETIAPLLQLNPGEVLINFMTGHIQRFLDSPQEETQASFKRLFGSATFREKIQNLDKQQDREDTAIQEYTRNAKLVGGFKYACNAIVLSPVRDRTHFNLIYLTRHPEGVKVFKEAERKAMEVQEAARAEAQQRKRVAKGQPELFGSKVLHDSSHYESLRNRYLAKTRDLVLQKLKSKRRLLYDDAWILALSEPMSWESDLKEWIEEWKREGLLEVTGMQQRQRVPRRNENNYLIWK